MTRRKQGGSPRAVDLFIAATARVHQVPLFTCNVADFELFAELIEVHEVRE